MGVFNLSSTEVDECPMSSPSFSSIPSNDADQDGCEDATEDIDDDNDGTADAVDDCPESPGSSSLGALWDARTPMTMDTPIVLMCFYRILSVG